MAGAGGGRRPLAVAADAYADLASAWDAATGLLYGPLAETLVAASPMPLGGRLVLDVGSGTGAMAAAALAAGAQVVAVDRSVGMVAHQRDRPWPALAGDVLALPCRQSAFDAALAGFLLNHLPPKPALVELGRVVRPGGVVLASTWASGRPDPVKTAMDAVLIARGWSPPEWYQRMKAEVEPVSGSPGRLFTVAGEAGLAEVTASLHLQEVAVSDPAAVVAYRLAMPQIAPWVAGLDGRAQEELRRQALTAVAPHLGRWRPAAIFLICRVSS